MIIALSTVVDESLLTRILVVSIIALIATVGVYGIVALIIRMDEFGYRLIRLNGKDKSFSDSIGNLLVNALPWVIKTLSIVGTIALILVTGGIFLHNIDFLHELFHNWPMILSELLVGLVVGFAILPVVNLFKIIWKKVRGRGKSEIAAD